MTNTIALVLALLFAACGDNTTPVGDPDAAIEVTPDAAELVDARFACETYGYRVADATKECGGDTTPAVERWAALCAPVVGTLPVAQVEQCAGPTGALQAHGCDGTAPTWDSKALACLATFGGP